MRVISIEFKNHKILGDLFVDFQNSGDILSDTIILAGENGTGKTTIINTIYAFCDVSNWVKYYNDGILRNCEVTVECSESYIETLLRITNANEFKRIVKYTFTNSNDFVNSCEVTHYKLDGEAIHAGVALSSILSGTFNNFHRAIYNDVQINFTPKKIKNVASTSVDQDFEVKRSSENMATEITQLFIDIKSQDAMDLNDWINDNIGQAPPDSQIDKRIKRFNNAFSYIFDGLQFHTIDTLDDCKKVCFINNGKKVYIEDLSSGEKQIVFRGAFILRDSSILRESLLIVDEPEISLHPNWQKKILDFYKLLITDSNGKQTCQLFAVTHSPFVIHNDARKNDKVIVLKRNEQGIIIVEEHPQYYHPCNVQVIEDAFNISDFSRDMPVLFVEGITDERYFKKTLEVFNIQDFPYEIKSIGIESNQGGSRNTGSSALDRAALHFSVHPPNQKMVLLYDSDCHKSDTNSNNLYIRSMEYYGNTDTGNSKKMKKGIENALELSSVDIRDCYDDKEINDDYGAETVIKKNLNKVRLCNKICNDTLALSEIQKVLSNLYDTIVIIRQI